MVMAKKNKLTKFEEEILEMQIMELKQEKLDEDNPDWKFIQIDGETTSYLISNCGDIANIKTDNIMTPIESEYGYMRVTLHHKGKAHTVRIHRLVALYFIPNPDNKPEVNHKDGNKKRNWYGNLEWVTSKENKQHAIELGLYDEASFTKVGMDRPNAVYTDEQVHQVCKLLEQGKQPKEVSEILNVPVTLPSYIKYAGKWKHISSQYKIPKPGDLPREKGKLLNSKVNSHERIHEVCRLLESGKEPLEISKLLDMPVSSIAGIKGRTSWTSISKLYDIPVPVNKTRPDNTKQKVIDLLKNGINDYGEILRKLDLPDDRRNRKYIALVKHQSKL